MKSILQLGNLIMRSSISPYYNSAKSDNSAIRQIRPQVQVMFTNQDAWMLVRGRLALIDVR